MVDYEDIMSTEGMPRFEHNVQWKSRRDRDRSPGRTVSPEPDRRMPPSLRLDTRIVRQRSSDSQKESITKKSKAEDMVTDEESLESAGPPAN